MVVGSGTITDEDTKALALSVMSDPLFHPDIRFFADYTRITALKVTGDGLAKVGSMLGFSEKSRRAFLVSDPKVAGTVHFFKKNLPRQAQTGVFYTRRDALAWLNQGQPAEKHIK